MIRHFRDIQTSDTECYHGLRMTAEEYLALNETQERYELIDGVVCLMSEPAFIPEDEEVFHGLRMTAEEYHAIGETQLRYELIDGVVCMSPSPTPLHQRLITQLSAAITYFANARQLGEALVEVDVHLGKGPLGSDLVYRPDIIFLSKGKMAQVGDRIVVPPDLAVEIISFRSRRMDYQTKKDDYERFGVAEYWLIDPERGTMDFFTLRNGRYEPIPVVDDKLHSEVISGFELDLPHVRAIFVQ